MAGLDVFLDSADSKVRDAVHIVFANESVREGELEPSPNVEDVELFGAYRILSLESLVKVKLTAWRDKDRTHLRDMIEVGLVGDSWLSRLPPGLANRLQGLLEDPEG